MWSSKITLTADALGHWPRWQRWSRRQCFDLLLGIIQTLMARVSDLYYKNETSASTSRPPTPKYEAFVHPRKIEIFVRCSELTQLDTFSKSDPLCVLFLKRLGQWSEYGRTESMPNNLNPRVSNSVFSLACYDVLGHSGGKLDSMHQSVETWHP